MLARNASPLDRGDRLFARRRAARRRELILIATLAFVIIGAGVWSLWRPQLRIANVTISNNDPALLALAEQKLAGSYFGIVPRDSIFFPPAHAIRAALLAANPDIATVSIVRSGFTALTITLNLRAAVGRWCGSMYSPQVALAPSTVEGSTTCYLFDASGSIYAAAGDGDETVNPATLFAPLANPASGIVGGIILDADKLPALFDFAREITGLSTSIGTSVLWIAIRADEVDDYLASGTRITYVLGDEQNAFALLSSSKSDLNLADGPVEYVDLRFTASGRVYFKKSSGK
ncbi:hypothetical protein HY091_00775 [Candidatus Kaiserbacteria bacterium]|nr:hypothetical protein [Candidatus Kaiserbacteria bacterium]